jgi:hypothetical protein
MVMVKTQQDAVLQAGLTAAALVPQVVHLAGRGGLVAAARMLPLSALETEQASWMTC